MTSKKLLKLLHETDDSQLRRVLTQSCADDLKVTTAEARRLGSGPPAPPHLGRSQSHVRAEASAEAPAPAPESVPSAA